MPFIFENLDDQTRAAMLAEVMIDSDKDEVYESPRLTAEGRRQWAALFRDAVDTGDADTLRTALGVPGGSYINMREPDVKNGGDKDVPFNAAQVMAEGEFNRFYIRALCVRATNEGSQLEVYRARYSAQPDAESQAKIGTHPDPQALLNDLRTHQGVATALGLPPHPNSGLSVRLVG